MGKVESLCLKQFYCISVGDNMLVDYQLLCANNVIEGDVVTCRRDFCLLKSDGIIILFNLIFATG